MAVKVTPDVRFRDAFCIETVPSPCGIVIFGASGDLTYRKLIPALSSLYQKSLLPKNFFVLGVARSSKTSEAFRLELRERISAKERNADELARFLDHVHYLSGGYEDPALYAELRDRLRALDERYVTRNQLLFYLATPPSLYRVIPHHLSRAGITGSPDSSTAPRVRIIIEKPFGHDSASSLELDRSLKEVLDEKQIYRIDHYFGKETVQNILIFRFANSIFEPFWNRQHIDHVQISVAESIGVEHRAGYFEQAGLLRDMVQNHVMLLLTLVAMEPPTAFDNRFRDEVIKLMRSIQPFSARDLSKSIIRGQYDKGVVMGRPAVGYREEKDVRPDSLTETFVAARLAINNWRWEGVPFYIRVGKRLERKTTEISVHFRPVPHSMFGPIRPEELPRNVLVFNVQPEEGIRLTISAKHPGPKLCMSALTMNFDYREVFGTEPPEAYERLLLDAMVGDQTLFIREDAMRVFWSLIDPILEQWKTEALCPLYRYEAGSAGPKEANALIARDGRAWW